MELPDTPGQLLKVADILAQANANVIKLDHNQAKVTDSFKKVQLEVTVGTQRTRSRRSRSIRLRKKRIYYRKSILKYL